MIGGLGMCQLVTLARVTHVSAWHGPIEYYNIAFRIVE